MAFGSIQDRYDEFQEKAVLNVLADFTSKPNGHYLLVIPTGGGKTFTAVKAINRLFEQKVLGENDRVLWTAHRTELIAQAQDTFSKFRVLYPHRKSFHENVQITMIGAAEAAIQKDGGFRLLVLDEAHHAALTNVSYGPLFAHKNLGILGLTATPSRHDGEPLDFERESFSIGFPDLVKKGIVLRPEIRKVKGGTFGITDLSDDSSLEQLDTQARNQQIIAELLNHTNEYKKIIIYVGTVAHVQSLYDLIKNSPLTQHYQSVSYILGNGNSRNQDRDAFIAQEKAYERSILVNVAVLTEGYDDPTVNAVVMATPSQSKLYYMQAMGRAIRLDIADPLKKAYCIEVEDDLPNIRYRIDNRWLFSDVSDELEPAVVDIEYGTETQFNNAIESLFDQFGVPPDQRHTPPYDINQRYSVLFFKRYLAPGNYAHFPLVITNDNRLQIGNFFNFLSARMQRFKSQSISVNAAFNMVGSYTSTLPANPTERRWIYEAMKSAAPNQSSGEYDEFEAKGYPWITYAALHYRQVDVSEDVLNFTRDMINREAILEMIRDRDFEEGFYLIRLPLPLAYFIGRIVTDSEFLAIDQIVCRLRKIRTSFGDSDHRVKVTQLLSESILPIELAHQDSLVQIARTDEDYSLHL